MTHYRQFFDSDYIGHWDLEGGRDTPVTITRVKGDTVEGEKGRKARKIILFFAELEKPFVCNVTNAKTIAAIYGTDVLTWAQKPITLCLGEARNPSTGEMGPCLRVRPTPPKMPRREGAQRREREAPPAIVELRACAAAEALVELLARHAPFFVEHHKKAWPIVEARCAELGLPLERAVEAVAAARSQG
ncbi:MAG: hypothetical protein RLO52_34605 [Sandaracinaceae bacterium]